MASELKVELDRSDVWLIKEKDVILARFSRLEDARAYARAELLRRGEGSVVIFTPSGRQREKLTLEQTAAGHLQVA